MLKIILLIIYFLSFFGMAACQSKIDIKAKSKENIKFAKITPKKFSDNLNSMMAIMNSKHRFTKSDYIILIKTYNTLHLDNVSNDKAFKSRVEKFLLIFRKKYLQKIIIEFHFTIWGKLSLYSKELDLYLAPSISIRNIDLITLVK